MTDEIALKNCPFCGGKAKLTTVRRGKYTREGDNWQGLCKKCHARGPLVQDDPQVAADKWNASSVSITGAPPPALPSPSVHAAAHYSTWLEQESHRHAEPNTSAFRNAASVLSVLDAEIRRLHAELIVAETQKTGT